MKTTHIMKALAMAMLMPAMLFTSCGKDKEVTPTIDDNTAKNGYELQVTVNVTCENDDTPAAGSSKTMRADYNDGTKKLEFSSGDKLFVEGSHIEADRFAGTLDYVPATGKFSGTIYTESLYEGTIDDLLNGNYATLLPAGYESYDYLEIMDEGYEAHLGENAYNSFATSKKLAVEQLSFEHGEYTSGTGFVLEPRNAILNITITGLTASTEVTAALSDDEDWTPDIEGEVTTDGSGNATFAIGLEDGSDLNEFSLTVAGNPVTLVSSSKVLVAGKIYNITRDVAPAPAATSLSELKTAINGGTDCSSYIGWEVNSAGAIAESGISGTKIGYVAYVSTSDVDAGVSGSRILVLANVDAGTSILWGSYGTSRGLTADDLNGYSNTNTLQGYGSEAHSAAYAAWNYSAAIPSGGATPAHWFMPTKKQWENMRDVYGGSNLNNRKAMESAYGINGNYWSSTEYNNVRAYRFSTNGGLQYYVKNGTSATNVRAVFAY